MANAFVARPSPARLALMVVGCFVFALMGLWMLGAFGPEPDPDKAWVGWLAVILSGFAAVYGIFRLFDRRDQIVVNAEGISWAPWSDRIIPWSAISDMTILSFRRQRILSLHLHDPKAHPPTTFLGRMAGINSSLGYGHVTISAAGTDRSFDELIEAIETYRPQA